MRLEHHVADHLVKLRCGEAFDFSIPAAPTYGNPTAQLEYGEPLPFEGQRLPSTKSPFNYRGTMVGINDNRLMPFESGLERKAELCFQTDPRVVRIEPQPYVITYRCPGRQKTKKHIIDFKLGLADGTSVLVAAKPTGLLIRTGLLQLLLRVWDQGLLAGLADRLSFVTEQYATDDAANNALDIIKARRLRNEAEYEVALNIVKGVRGPVRFRALLAGAEPPAYRRIALWNLIDEGHLRPIESGRIEDHSLLISTL